MTFDPKIANTDLGHGGLSLFKWAVIMFFAAQVPLAGWLSKTLNPEPSYLQGSDDATGLLVLAGAIEVAAVVFFVLGISAAADRKKLDLKIELEKLEKLEVIAQRRSAKK